jgi:hypothetical protein
VASGRAISAAGHGKAHADEAISDAGYAIPSYHCLDVFNGMVVGPVPTSAL